MRLYKVNDEYSFKKEVYNLTLKANVKVRRKWEQLDIGDFAYINNTENKIKKVSNTEFEFYRFEDITTHIENLKTNESAESIIASVISKLDYTLKYAEDRVDLVNELMKDKEWIYDLLSDHDVIKKTHKRKKDPLAENQVIDRLLDSISTYINYAKFKNEEDETEFNTNKQRLKEFLKLKALTPEEEIEYNNLTEYFSGYHPKITFNTKYLNSKEELIEDISSVEDRVLMTEEQRERQKKLKENYKIIDLKLSKKYFEEMFKKRERSTIPDFLKKYFEFKDGIEFRYQSNKVFEKELDKLSKYLGFNIKDKEMKKAFTENLISKVGKQKYNKIKRMYIGLKSDHAYAKEILADVVKFAQIPKPTTEYSIYSDTWYYDSNGEAVDVSKNFVNLADPKTYRGMILNYTELKDKYIDKMYSDIWALLFVFEELLIKTKLNKDEVFILKNLFMNYSQKEIAKAYEDEFEKTITSRRVSNIINNIIPKKIVDVYLGSVEDWLYTYRIKGRFKKCSRCSEIKVLNERNFRARSDCKGDGYYNQCRICEK